DGADLNSTTRQGPDNSGFTSTWENLSQKSDSDLLQNLAAGGVGALVMALVGGTVVVVCKRCKGKKAALVPEQLARDYSDVVDTTENTTVDESAATQAVVAAVNYDDDGDFTSRVTLVNEQNQPADSVTQHAAPSMDLPALFAEVVPEQLARDYSDVVDTIENPTVDESRVAQAVVVVVNDDDDGDFTSRVTLVNKQNQPADSLSQHAAPPMDLPALFGADTVGSRDYVSVSKIRDAKRRAMDETQCCDTGVVSGASQSNSLSYSVIAVGVAAVSIAPVFAAHMVGNWDAKKTDSHPEVKRLSKK
ncbi:hypothetical protein BaRGS_00024919, partial [Batillaria attramentaria]